jgi:hypothetical protein
MNIILGRISEIVDEHKFVIKFNSPGLIDEQCLAYPVDTFDEPNVDDEILLFSLNDKFEYSWFYKKLRLEDHTRLKLLESLIDVTKDSIEIHTSDGRQKIFLQKDGTLEILTGEGKQKILLDEAGTLTVSTGDGKQVVKLEETGKITIEAGQQSIVLSQMGIKYSGTIQETDAGVVVPNAPGGPWCAIPMCPLTGMAHQGNMFKKT